MALSSCRKHAPSGNDAGQRECEPNRPPWGTGPPCRWDPYPGLAALFPAELGGDGAMGLVRPKKSQKFSTSHLLELIVPRNCHLPLPCALHKAVSMLVREQGWPPGWDFVSLELEESCLIRLPTGMRRCYSRWVHTLPTDLWDPFCVQRGSRVQRRRVSCLQARAFLPCFHPSPLH